MIINELSPKRESSSSGKLSSFPRFMFRLSSSFCLKCRSNFSLPISLACLSSATLKSLMEIDLMRRFAAHCLHIHLFLIKKDNQRRILPPSALNCYKNVTKLCETFKYLTLDGLMEFSSLSRPNTTADFFFTQLMRVCTCSTRGVGGRAEA
jgi:hypothetical protein